MTYVASNHGQVLMDKISFGYMKNNTIATRTNVYYACNDNVDIETYIVLPFAVNSSKMISFALQADIFYYSNNFCNEKIWFIYC